MQHSSVGEKPETPQRGPHQHGDMFPEPRRKVALKRHQIKIEPLDEALARVVARISQCHHLILKDETKATLERVIAEGKGVGTAKGAGGGGG